jgi:6-pyruvoyltetrahydropterin/6-carboxytetrahydropterin synthase
MGRVRAHRYHDICAGHRVHNHESKCAHLHGHNYRFHFTVEGPQDALGRVMDFSVIKEKLCMWLEDTWDHKFIVGTNDPMKSYLQDIDPQGVIIVPFNPTAENMAKYMVEVKGPELLAGCDAVLINVTIDETAKCSASYEKA